MSLNSYIPPAPHSGEQITPEWGRAVVRALESLVPQGSPTISISSGPTGYTISTRPAPYAIHRKTPKPAKPAPLYLSPILTTDIETGEPAWSVTPGHVNGILPRLDEGTRKVARKRGMPNDLSSDPREWAMPLTENDWGKGIHLTAEWWLENSDGAYAVRWKMGIELLQTGQDVPNTDTKGYWLIGEIIREGNDGWKVASYNHFNQHVIAMGYGFNWSASGFIPTKWINP